ncbi:MAG TPA: GH1 family beta-glucosidase [Gemmatimonadales bacterium]|nr:GH1 family beta-glucosidase [Gemmatimonadales bacterium]
MSDPTRFPEDFLWGAATSAYQVEGSPLADGAGPSIWHRFAHSPGLTAGGETGDIACDHYRRWNDDVLLMAELGLNAYRFSLSWSRILPDGRGKVNQAGLDFYSRLVDALLAKHIQPNVTLYHWDLPAALDDRGGWLNPDITGWFADYAAVAFKALGDRVKMWATLNEPWVVVDGGYLHGALAPGHRNIFEAPRVAHHLLLSHGAAVQAYRSAQKGNIGIVLNIEPKHPASQDPKDLEAVRRADAYMNRQYLEPVLGRPYPAELAGVYGPGWDERVQQDIPKIAQPIDFLGINYYTRGVTRDDPAARPVRTSPVRLPGATYTETGWEVYPAGLTETLLWVKERAGALPLYVTENGAAFPDPPHLTDGKLDDGPRVAYYRDHLRAALEARRRGVDLRGYFAWSLLDNFEWSLGYAKRFGIVHVDFTTQQRTLKASARAYRDVIKSRGAALAD